MYNYIQKKNGELNGELISLYEFSFSLTKGIITKETLFEYAVDKESVKGLLSK